MSPPQLPANIKVLTVSGLTRAVKGLLEDAFPLVYVTGEISGVARPSSGHLYFKLKDSESQLASVIYRGVAMRLRFDPKDGMEVIARGRISVYPPRGEYQFAVEELHAKGIGAQEMALRQLKEKLFRLGYFAPERKKPLPSFPHRIALVTSPSGAAVRDMLEVLARRWPAVEVWVCPVRVQGEGAAEEIAAAIRLLNRLHQNGRLPLDVMIVGRGGGSAEDLGAFNAEGVAQAVFESRVPVVSAVGHEIDVTVADMVADLRALTPTDAAKRVVPDAEEIQRGLDELGVRLRDGLLRQVRVRQQRLDDLANRRMFRRPLERIRDEEQGLDEWGQRLGRALKQRLQQMRERLQAEAARLETLSPLNVLGRGYSLTRRETDSAVVRGSEQVKPGDRLKTTVQNGWIVSRVEEAGPTVS